jgi:hypothetical protein
VRGAAHLIEKKGKQRDLWENAGIDGNCRTADSGSAYPDRPGGDVLAGRAKRSADGSKKGKKPT